MSVRIRVSYTEDEEITKILGALSAVESLTSCKIRSQKGRYKRAYICSKNDKNDCKNGS